MFGTGTELMLSSLDKFDKDMAKEAAWQMFRDVLIDFPFGWMPAIIRPTVGAIANYDDFTKNNIVPGWMQRMELPERQYLHYTTETFKTIGKAFKVSPAKLEHAVNQYTGGLGRRIIRGVEVLAGMKDWPTHISAYPMVGAMTSPEFRGARDVQRIFDLSDELGKLQRAGKITSSQLRYRKVISDARRRITKVAKDVREGRMSREEGDRKKYEIAVPIIKRYERYAK
jgi:hypothetical protein